MYRISVIITVFNRKVKTLECLGSLYKSFNSFNTNGRYKLEVFLTDDGSTDGTSDAVKEFYPEVQILKGTGSLYWNGGMINSWIAAAKKSPDFYLWLNDDTIINNDAFTNLYNDYEKLKNRNSILVGATQSLLDLKMTYGGEKNFIKLRPNGSMQLCDTFNGNFVLIPKYVYENIGMLDPVYSHSLGDFDYGRKATKAGFYSYLMSFYVGTCESNEGVKICFDAAFPLFKRLKNLYSPLGCNPKEFFIYDIKYFGLITAIKHFFSIHLKMIFPK